MFSAKEYNNYIIRTASKGDANEINYLVQRAFSTYGNNGCNPVLYETIEDIYFDLEKNFVLVLEYRNMIIGSLRLLIQDKNEFYLKRFSIHPDFQNLGMGTELYNQAEEIAKEKGGKRISLHSSIEDQGLVSFYRKLGFICLDKDNKNGYIRGFWQKIIPGVD